MSTVTKIGRHTVELYESIEELPIRRFHRYNKLLLIDAGIGSDIADVDKHFEKALIYLRNKDTAAAATELQNLRQNLHFVMTDIQPKYMAFAVLIKSLDGKECDDLSDDGLRSLVDKISDASVKDVAASMEAAKKKNR